MCGIVTMVSGGKQYMRCSGGTLAAGQEVSADALAKQVQHDQFQQQALCFRLIKCFSVKTQVSQNSHFPEEVCGRKGLFISPPHFVQQNSIQLNI